MPSPEDPILQDLTPAQLEAVTHLDGPMLVVAGAGSGKTRVVTRRIAWLLRNGVWPSQILAMTFTNKAAREMRERVEALAGDAPRAIGTFHGCCARFLRRDIDKLPGCGRTRDFAIYDEDERKSILSQVLSDFHGTTLEDQIAEITPRELGSFIDMVKNLDVDYRTGAELCQAIRGSLSADAMQALGERYEAHMTRCNAVDFDDLLLLTVKLLREVPGMREIYQNRYRYLLVDEYQDTNHVQYELIRLLANEKNNVHVTGDPDQSIYSWRGADYQNIMSFERDFPGAKRVVLEQNYRSTPRILAAANALIRWNTDRIEKNLFTKNPDGPQITDMLVDTDREESEWIRKKLAGLHRRGAPWRSFAIFYRTNAQSRALEEEFVHYGIPYQLLGGIRFYERKEVKDYLSLLRLVANPSDQVAFLRTLTMAPRGKGLGKVTAAKLTAQADATNLPILDYLASDLFVATQKGKSQRALRLRLLAEWMKELQKIPRELPAAQAIQEIEACSGILDCVETLYGTENIRARKENIQSLFEKADIFTREHPEGTLRDFLEEVALVADVDAHDPQADSVLLMTLHSAKGLEFPYVFITGVEEGLLPHGTALECGDLDGDEEESRTALEEERRLFYVGITRARQALFLTHARLRGRWGNGFLEPTEPSRFLTEIPPELRQRKQFHHGIEQDRYSDSYPAETPYFGNRTRGRR